MYKSQREIFSENLQRLIDARKIDQKDLAEKINVSTQAVSSWVNGQKYPRIDKVQKIADFFRVSKSDLLELQPTNTIPATSHTVAVPVLGSIACGEPILVENNLLGYRYEAPDSLPSGSVFYLQSKGDSMEPTIPEGGFVLVREQPEVEHGQIAAVLLNGDTEAVLKRVKKQDGLVLLLSDNPKYTPIVITPRMQARIIGRAVRVSFDL